MIGSTNKISLLQSNPNIGNLKNSENYQSFNQQLSKSDNENSSEEKYLKIEELTKLVA